MKKHKIGIIGGGNMGEAFIKGLIKNKLFSVSVFEANPARVSVLKKKYKSDKIAYEENIAALLSKADSIILAVKPQDMHVPLSWMKKEDSIKNKLFISIAAGLTTKFFEESLPGKPHAVRAMPNLPALINKGMTGICRGKYATDKDLKTAQEILNTIGETVVVKESMMDAVTAVSGSGPAYVFLFVEKWIAAAMSLGLDETNARNLVYETLIGSAHALKEHIFTAKDLRERVTSKGGTTEAAMKVFFKGNALGRLMKNALSAAKKRAKELAK